MELSWPGFDSSRANGTTKLVNLSTNVAAATTFSRYGSIADCIASPAALASVVGHFIGTVLVARRGSRLIRSVFLAVLLLLCAKVAMDFT